MQNKNIFFVFVVIIFLIAGFFLINHSSKNFRPENIQYIKIGGKIIKVEIASTSEMQEKGLSGRKEMNEDEGMLFVFSAQGGSASGGEINNRHSFWMKDMNFAIDIVWLDEDLNVIYIKKNAEPESFPESFGPNKNAKYVLELISGFSEKNNLKEGDSAKFLP